MVVYRHHVGRFVGEFDYEDGFGYLCCGRFSVFVRCFYNSGFRMGSVVHCVHCPHSFPQLVHLFLCQRRNGCALFAACHIRRKDRQDILPADVVHVIVGGNVLAVVLYCIGDFFQSVAVFRRQRLYRLLDGDGICTGRIGGKKDAVGRTGHKCHKTDDNDNAECHADAYGNGRNKAVEAGEKVSYGRAYRCNRPAGIAGSFLDSKLYLAGAGMHLCLSCYAPHSFIFGSTQLALTLGHTANIARHGLGGDGFFFCPLSGQICPTTRTLLCIGQRTVPSLFRADTALTGGVGTGSLSPLCCAAFPVFLNLLAGKLAHLLHSEIGGLLYHRISCICHC